MILYQYSAKNMEDERREYLRHLYHDKWGGQVIRLKKNDKGVSTYSTCDLEDLMMTGTDTSHFYTTVNTFRGSKRSADKLYCYCSIYIDLDCHVDDPEVVTVAKKNTVEVLERAYASGKLAIPTMITDTGRGFGIQYVLNHSIANANNEAQRTFFKKVRQGVFEQYKKLMESSDGVASADPAVLDDARVCRLVGTYNASADQYCHLISAEGRYYELSDLVKECHLWEWKDKPAYLQDKEKRAVKKNARGRKIIPFKGNYEPFLRNRVEQLKTLQKLRGEACTDSCREQMLFIAYSALVQIDRMCAIENLQAFNGEFAKPLDQKELDHIIKECAENEKGFYKLPDEYVVRTLDLTEEEIAALGFGSGWRRSAAKRETAKKRNEIRNQVVDLLRRADRLTYNEIADQVGISRRKVCTIAKEAGISRYKKSVLQDSEKAEVKKEPEIAEFTESAESAKNCIESVCVYSSMLSLRSRLCDFSSTGVIFSRLLELFDECLGVSSLRMSVFNRMSLAVDSYTGMSYGRLVEAQVADLSALAKLKVTVPPLILESVEVEGA